jgi:hypothetical protein
MIQQVFYRHSEVDDLISKSFKYPNVSGCSPSLEAKIRAQSEAKVVFASFVVTMVGSRLVA